MQILLALIAGTAIGLGAHFMISQRDTRGLALAPILGATVAGAAWTGLTWLGQGLDSPWLWMSGIVVPAVIVPLTLIVLSRARTARDTKTRQRLGI